MTIPLDNLYHYIYGLFSEPVCVYLFYPHGSRNILNLILLHPPNKIKFGLDGVVLPQIICNDQEPLDYEMYQALTDQELEQLGQKFNRNRYKIDTNLKAATPFNIYDKTMLLHSEKNSLDLEKYENDLYIGVYYWCHAIIARDWYRFAEHDYRLNNTGSPDKDFLIYCRDWSGSREYRIKFQELLYNNNLTDNSMTSIKKDTACNDVETYNFKNRLFAPANTDFLSQLANNQFDSSSSADYCPDDFNQTMVSVVLETVFDDTKIHLTEKILRPIACGHPFILAAGPGSLEYLRGYGFKTFSPWIDEDYDLEADSFKRLEKIIASMKQFANLPAQEKIKVHNKIKQIADYNRQWFFSDEFFKMVTSELILNINTAMQKIKNTRSLVYRTRNKDRSKSYELLERKNIISKYLRDLKKINPPGK
jgi:hypothetical protein